VIEDPTLTGVWPDLFVAELPDIRAGLREYAATSLASQVRRLRIRGVKTDIAMGLTAQTIAMMAEHRKCDLIVMGTHGRSGLSHVVLGSVAERVLRMAPCPVLAVREPKRRKTARPRSRRQAA
jgi:nucleotide-binding universal stress UspA family protein